MKKEELLNRITDSPGSIRISSLSSKEEAEHIVALAKHLEYEGKIVLSEYCIENKPISVSLTATQIT
ncbi:hypothetical protein [Neobacillus terrae]|uniref:hypothetical protein n=1 Tax=Neobacillus terrae TaxID=3034837 RepID=UPI001409B4C0|nr:hypothetical protein [Neobacillus terrae]NHM33988.1 hypothetical protein [Neobacillus terrae]